MHRGLFKLVYCGVALLAGALLSAGPSVGDSPPPPETFPYIFSTSTGGNDPMTCDRAVRAAARLGGARITVVLSLQTSGRVSDVTVKNSSGDADLDKAEVSCASRLIFKPATRNGQPVESQYMMTLKWSFGCGGWRVDMDQGDGRPADPTVMEPAVVAPLMDCPR